MLEEKSTNYSIKRYNVYFEEELIKAVKKFTQENKSNHVSGKKFCRWFNISHTTIERKFGFWANFCKKANSHPRYDRSISREKLFKNLENVWEKLGRHPRSKEMKQPLSPISITQYQKLFKKTWYEICLEFIGWKTGASINDIKEEIQQTEQDVAKTIAHKIKRTISLAVRYDVLKRDGFKCLKCGRSPATETSVKLHVDHISPYSKDWETIMDNLQTLCSDCNIGKSNK